MATRHAVHPSGKIVILTHFAPWKSHLYELPGGDEVLYVLYQDSGKSWRVQCVPESEGSFVSRKPLPAEWRGVRDDVLSQLAEIPGCIFVHASGFIGGAASREGALAMAVKALEAEQ